MGVVWIEEMYWRPCETSVMENFVKNSWPFLVIDYFPKTAQVLPYIDSVSSKSNSETVIFEKENEYTNKQIIKHITRWINI